MRLLLKSSGQIGRFWNKLPNARNMGRNRRLPGVLCIHPRESWEQEKHARRSRGLALAKTEHSRPRVSDCESQKGRENSQAIRSSLGPSGLRRSMPRGIRCVSSSRRQSRELQIRESPVGVAIRKRNGQEATGQIPAWRKALRGQAYGCRSLGDDRAFEGRRTPEGNSCQVLDFEVAGFGDMRQKGMETPA